MRDVCQMSRAQVTRLPHACVPLCQSISLCDDGSPLIDCLVDAINVCRHSISGERRAAIVTPPSTSSLFDVRFDANAASGEGAWLPWHLPTGTAAAVMIAGELFVHTIESVRLCGVLLPSIAAGRSGLIVGPSGSGKSTLVRSALLSDLAALAPKLRVLPTALSASTTSGALQDIIEAALVRRRSYVFGPASHGMRVLVAIDDVNLAPVSSATTRPAMELLRQLLSAGGWFTRTRDSEAFCAVVDTQLMMVATASGSTGAAVDARVAARMAVVGSDHQADSTLATMFTARLKSALAAAAAPARGMASLRATSADFAVPLAAATVRVAGLLSQTLPPSPARPYMRYSAAQIYSVIVGLCRASDAVAVEEASLTRLWAHECMRVFGDRISSDSGDAYGRAAIIAALSTASAECLGVPLVSMFSSSSGDGFDQLEDAIEGNIFVPLNSDGTLAPVIVESDAFTVSDALSLALPAYREKCHAETEVRGSTAGCCCSSCCTARTRSCRGATVSHRIALCVAGFGSFRGRGLARVPSRARVLRRRSRDAGQHRLMRPTHDRASGGARVRIRGPRD